MRQPRGIQEYGKDGCCPEEWNHVPNVTGSYELDGMIMKCKNSDMAGRLADHVAGDAYRVGNGYSQSSID